MKKMIVVMALIISLLLINGCSNTKNDPPKDKAELVGVVHSAVKTDSRYSTIFIKDAEGAPYTVYLNEAKDVPDIAAGDKIKVIYDGIVRESYPMQITAEEVQVVSNLSALSMTYENVIITEGRYTDVYFEQMDSNLYYYKSYRDFTSFRDFANEVRLGESLSGDGELKILQNLDKNYFEKHNLHIFVLPTGSTPQYYFRDVLSDSKKMLYLRIHKKSSVIQTEDIFFKVFIISLDKTTEIEDGTLLMDVELFDKRKK